MDLPFNTILCPTDLSETGNQAVPIAYRLVAGGGTVHLLHVCEPPHLGNPLYEQYVHGYVPTPEETDAGRDRVKRDLHKLPPKSALAQNVRTEFHILDGVDVAGAIHEGYKQVGADAIVMGTHGRTGLGRLLMGSVATDVMKLQDAIVILVSGEGEDD